MSRPLLLAIACVVALSAGPASSLSAQASGAPALPAADVTKLAGLHVQLVKLQDSMNAEMAAARNKTPERQATLQEELRTRREALVKAAGLSDEEYTRRRLLVSSDATTRATFDEAVIALQGVLPGRVAASAAAAPSATEAPKLPAGPMGAHIGHVMVSFADTPDKVGLLAIAQAEAATASQHAAFAARTPTNLESMKRHAAHVIHAIDPTLEPMGPGKGYGVIKGATAVATHIEMAAKVETAPAGVRTHAGHVATAARSTVTRAEQVVALARRIVAAATAEEAAALVAQLASLCDQLVAGTDLNADGRISWGNDEGGLQQAEEHLKLLLAAAVPTP